ncbi:hypothetical protein BASA62_006615 [Batrachochytrium salamandrivorans]|nr:hypothetical protein BASA62_006615 [Batrachochytrium salamandrivorans]
MQFFYLFSFVVVASYAAALPQPAEISEKHSNDVNTNLAYDLETRSYQPVFNSQGDSATLTSLKRRDNGGSGTSSPPAMTPKKALAKSLPRTMLKATTDGISNILKNVGSDIENVQKLDEAFRHIFYNRTSLIYKIRTVLGRFTTGKTLQGYLADISRSIGRFLAGQHHLHLAIIREFNAASSQ